MLIAARFTHNKSPVMVGPHELVYGDFYRIIKETQDFYKVKYDKHEEWVPKWYFAYRTPPRYPPNKPEYTDSEVI